MNLQGIMQNYNNRHNLLQKSYYAWKSVVFTKIWAKTQKEVK